MPCMWGTFKIWPQRKVYEQQRIDNYCANENNHSPFLYLRHPKLPLRPNAFVRRTVRQASSPEFEARISSGIHGKGEQLLSHLVRNDQQKMPQHSLTINYFSSGLTNRTARPGVTTCRALALGKAFLALGQHIFDNSIACVCLCWPMCWPPNDMKGRTSYVLTCYSVAVPCTVLLQRAFLSSDFCSLKTWCLLFLKTGHINYSSWRIQLAIVFPETFLIFITCLAECMNLNVDLQNRA